MDAIPSFSDAVSNVSSGAGLSQDVATLAPLATTYHGAQSYNNANIPQMLPTSSTASPGVVDQFFHKVGSVFSESGHMFEGAAQWVGRQGLDMAKSAVDFLPSVTRFGIDAYHISSYGHQATGILNQISDLGHKYDSGLINSQQYHDGLQQLNKQMNDVADKNSGMATKIAYDGNQVTRNTIGVASDVITIMTAGLSSPLTMTAEQGTKDAAVFLLSKAADEAMLPGEQAIGKLAANKALLDALPAYIQNATKASVTDTFMNLAAQATSREAARATAVNLLFKYPLAYNYLSGTANDIAGELQTGKYGKALETLGFNTAMLLSGGPIGQALKYGGKALGRVGSAIFGSTAFLDEMSKIIGDGNPSGLYNAIKSNPEAIRAFQSLEATNMAAEDNKAVSAAYRIANGLKANGWDLSKSTHDEFVSNVMSWHGAQTILSDSLKKAGYDAAAARKFVVGRWTVQDANRAAAAVTKGDVTGFGQSTEQRLSAWEEFKAQNPNSAAANNENLDKQITGFIKTFDDPSMLHSKISGIEAQFAARIKGLPVAASRAMAKLGYVPIAPSKLEAPFIQGTQKLLTNAGETDAFFQKAVQPLPVMGEFGSLLKSIGLSPERSQQSTLDLFRDNLARNLKETSLLKDNMFGEDTAERSKGIIQDLSNFVNETNVKAAKLNLNAMPISDMRQLTTGEIGKALGVGTKEATEVAKSINQSMLDISWSERGLAGKLMDYVQSVRAGSKLSMNGYLRAQSAGRFAWNPFFKMKLAYKTEALSQLESGGKWPTLFGTNKILGMVFQGRYRNLADTAKMLEDKGIFTAGFSNEAANEASAAFRATRPSQLTQSQKLSIAGLISSQAERAGMNVHTFADNFPNEVRDTTEAILHYNPKSDFLNSPLARTLNFAFFPFRFNLKVSTFIAQSLARQDALTQVAVIHGMMQAHSFLTSQQGQIWYSQNSDAIGLLSYFSPLETLSTVAKLGNIKNESIGSFGELGGLPVGFIPQLLQAEGMWNPSGAYLNPKTGVPSKEYIPVTMKAKLATALTSFMGSLFTYPGSTAGLPSKSGTLNKVTKALTGAKGTDWTTAPSPTLTPEQQQYQQSVQSLQATHGQPAGTVVNGRSLGTTIKQNLSDSSETTVPAQNTKITTPISKTGNLTSGKRKKASFAPELMPGQSSLGVIPGAQ